jgi:thioredoxin reductase (NADPH)
MLFSRRRARPRRWRDLGSVAPDEHDDEVGDDMVKVIVIGDGPAGLSATLLLAKNDVDTVVFAQDDTAMHYAELHNYLGIPTIGGSEFQRIARQQVTEHGATIREEEVAEVTTTGAGFAVRTADGSDATADYLVLAAGKPGQRLADELGVERAERGLVVDREQRTSVERVYAAGRVTRVERSQAIISAGDGARAALDILSREAGEDVHDWDSPPKGD